MVQQYSITSTTCTIIQQHVSDDTMTTVAEIYNLDAAQSSDDDAAIQSSIKANRKQANHTTVHTTDAPHANNSNGVDIIDSNAQANSIDNKSPNVVSDSNDGGYNNDIIDLMDEYSDDSVDDSDSSDNDIQSINDVDSSDDSSDDSDSIVSIDVDESHSTSNNVINATTVHSDTDSVQHISTKTSTNGIIAVGEYIDDSSNNRRKSNTIRYFAPTDITLKCWNCQGVGHYAENCPHEKIYKPCYICGVRNHQPWKCPNDICFRCNGIGHRAETCHNQRMNIVFCILCGSTQHTYSTCAGLDNTYKNDIKHTRCYICGEIGHINCNTNKSTNSTKRFKHIKSVQYCANCAATGHSYLTCTQKQMNTIIHVNDTTGQPVTHNNQHYDNDSYNNPNVRKCYICDSTDHIKADCPQLRNRRHTFSNDGNRSDRSTQHYNNNYRSVSLSRNTERTYVESYDKRSPRDRKRGRSRERSDRERNNNSRSASVSSNRSYTSNHRRKN